MDNLPVENPSEEFYEELWDIASSSKDVSVQNINQIIAQIQKAETEVMKQQVNAAQKVEKSNELIACPACRALMYEEDAPIHEEWHQTMFEAVKEQVEEQVRDYHLKKLLQEPSPAELWVPGSCAHNWRELDDGQYICMICKKRDVSING